MKIRIEKSLPQAFLSKYGFFQDKGFLEVPYNFAHLILPGFLNELLAAAKGNYPKISQTGDLEDSVEVEINSSDCPLYERFLILFKNFCSFRKIEKQTRTILQLSLYGSSNNIPSFQRICSAVIYSASPNGPKKIAPPLQTSFALSEFVCAPQEIKKHVRSFGLDCTFSEESVTIICPSYALNIWLRSDLKNYLWEILDHRHEKSVPSERMLIRMPLPTDICLSCSYKETSFPQIVEENRFSIPISNPMSSNRSALIPDFINAAKFFLLKNHNKKKQVYFDYTGTRRNLLLAVVGVDLKVDEKEIVTFIKKLQSHFGPLEGNFNDGKLVLNSRTILLEGWNLPMGCILKVVYREEIS